MSAITPWTVIQLSLSSCETNWPAVGAWQKIAAEVRLGRSAKGRTNTALRLEAIVRAWLTCGMAVVSSVCGFRGPPESSDGRPGKIFPAGVTIS
jgi:hypothetical protein